MTSMPEARSGGFLPALAAYAKRFFAWLWKPSDLGEEISAIPVLRVILNRKPVQGFFVTLFFTHGVFIILNGLMFGRWLEPSEWWVSSFYGDLALAAAVSIMLWMAEGEPYLIETGIQWMDDVLDWLTGHKVNYLFDLAILGTVGYVAWDHMLKEHASVGSWFVHTGILPSYHNFVLYPLLGYTLGRLFLRCLFRRWWKSPVHGVAMLAVLGLGWVWWECGAYDGTHPLTPSGQSKFELWTPVDAWGWFPEVFGWIYQPVGALF